MKEVYEKLVENLSSMTPEEKEKEWEIFKKYNEIGPSVEKILKEKKKIYDQYAYETSLLEQYGSKSIITFEDWLEIKGLKDLYNKLD